MTNTGRITSQSSNQAASRRPGSASAPGPRGGRPSGATFQGGGPTSRMDRTVTVREERDTPSTMRRPNSAGRRCHQGRDTSSRERSPRPSIFLRLRTARMRPILLVVPANAPEMPVYHLRMIVQGSHAGGRFDSAGRDLLLSWPCRRRTRRSRREVESDDGVADRNAHVRCHR